MENGTFVNYTTTADGYNVTVWEILGDLTNYWFDITGSLIPYELNQVQDDIQYFNPLTYKNYISDQKIFDLPSSQCNVNNSCPFSSLCTNFVTNKIDNLINS